MLALTVLYETLFTQFLSSYFLVFSPMTSPNSTPPNSPENDFFSGSFSGSFNAAWDLSRAIAERFQETSRSVGYIVGPLLQQTLELGTEKVGEVVSPIAENPLVKSATRIPGLSWLMAALGQVDGERVRWDVEALQQQYPTESPEQLAQRVITEASWKAAQVGLVTNFIPPVAFVMAPIDWGAITVLQANMIYRIATIYGFSPEEPARRGEVLTLWGLSSGGSGMVKNGLNVVELLPGVGTAVGITADVALLYGAGFLACQFYEAKRAKAQAAVDANAPTRIEQTEVSK